MGRLVLVSREGSMFRVLFCYWLVFVTLSSHSTTAADVDIYPGKYCYSLLATFKLFTLISGYFIIFHELNSEPSYYHENAVSLSFVNLGGIVVVLHSLYTLTSA